MCGIFLFTCQKLITPLNPFNSYIISIADTMSAWKC